MPVQVYVCACVRVVAVRTGIYGVCARMVSGHVQVSVCVCPKLAYSKNTVPASHAGHMEMAGGRRHGH